MSAAVPHVVVIAFPFASHAVKLFRLARALAAAAPAATFSFLSTAALLQEQQKKHDDTLAAVLRHASVGAFVTHAGWASVLEGVSAGVPMACRPFFTDQKMNAQLVARVWGFGTVLEEPMKREAVAEAVPLLLAGDQGIRMWEKMQEIQRMAASAFAPDGGSRENLDKLVKIVCGEL
ncbi:Anthocyanidin 3-O-glucosyltransferase [Triticum urartu]|uniref:Anthocyanidin 3-O-glucosyltransferase n=1 Tax=Triticum urartu TaxID=4572 RepID=M7YCX4_TRIUA|nr:Anthocyanidin 3-O-glucosyltransferase [Triticum urartu]